LDWDLSNICSQFVLLGRRRNDNWNYNCKQWGTYHRKSILKDYNCKHLKL
jgi:hypothetical protein